LNKQVTLSDTSATTTSAGKEKLPLHKQKWQLPGRENLNRGDDNKGVEV
jgi:hypothetical protein